MKRLTGAALLMVCVLTSNCDIAKKFSTNSLPDLTIGYVSYQTEPRLGCTAPNAFVVLQVYIINRGEGTAGAFRVAIDGEEQSVSKGLAAGASIALIYRSGNTAAMGSVHSITIDPENVIQESDKVNNSQANLMVPVLTMAPDCTVTPTGGNPSATS